MTKSMKIYEHVGVHVIYKNKENSLDESKFGNAFICHCNRLENKTAEKLRGVALRHNVPVICIVESQQTSSPVVTIACDSVGSLYGSTVYMCKNRFEDVRKPVIL